MLKHRYMVVDLNVIEEGLNNYIHDDDQVVLPHMIISDLAGIKEDGRISKHINCLPGWLRARGNQIWLARDWATIEEMEYSPDICINDLGWCDDKGSEVLRSGKDATSKQWLESFRDFESSISRQIVEEGRKAFLHGCEQIGKHIKINDPDIISQIKSSKCWRTEIVRLVREPIMAHIYALMDPKYQTQEWNTALGRYPDKFAIGRMSRIMCWYSILQAAGIRNVQSNDFEDTSYAHAASYTGFIATEDSCLSDMVKAVFDYVTIISKH